MPGFQNLLRSFRRSSTERDQRVEQLEMRLAELEIALGRLRNDMDEHGRRMGGIENGLDLHEERLVRLDRQMGSMAVAVASVTSRRAGE